MSSPLRTLALAGAAAGAAVGLLPSAASAAVAPLPAITHVWQIQLENQSAGNTYMPCATPGLVDPYINCSMVPSGVFLPNYYATGHVSLDNYIAQSAGIPGNPDTFSDCNNGYKDFVGMPDVNGAAVGSGCVYPATVQTMEDQLTGSGKTWQGLMGDMGLNAQRETAPCGQPAVNGTAINPSGTMPANDGTQAATPADQYAARHNPFVYFHSLLDSGSCAAKVEPLGTAAAPLATLDSTLTSPAAFTWITPNLCDDAHDTPCVGPDLKQKLDATTPAGAAGLKGPGGLSSADRFLSVVVPRIQASQAYKDGGLIILSFDEAAVTDPSSCCGQVPGTTGVQPAGGGGRIGLLLLSPLLHAGTVATPYNHYSLLRSLEDLYGITTGGADGMGHLAEAANARSFWADVTAATPNAVVPEFAKPALVLAGGMALGGYAIARRRRRSA